MSFMGSPSWPRDTSNGDYGRFHFLDTSRGGGRGGATPGPGGQFSTSPDGNQMRQHMHYPNCQNQGGNQQGQPPQEDGNAGGVQEYTIEYGEDAVRKALGGELPDFQAQFQQQYGNMAAGGGGAGDGDAGFKVSPEQMEQVMKQMNQMNMNGGKSQVTMLPVVLTSDDQGADAEQSQEQNSQSQSQNHTEGQGEGDPSQTTEASQGQAEKQRPPKPVNTLKTMESIRRSRSNGPVKYGRHIRPSYWNPQAPNPCRRKSDFGGENGNGDNCPEANQTPQGPHPNEAYATYALGNAIQYDGMTNGYGSQASMALSMPPGGPNNQGQMPMPPPQSQPIMSRGRSLPPKKPAASLCGKCQKCKNLTSTQDMNQNSLLTYPKYGGGRAYSGSNHKLNTSSNLSQSAKNFRAIRFSSNQRNYNSNMNM